MGKGVETEPLYPKRVDLDKMISQWKRGLISITIVGTAWIYFFTSTVKTKKREKVVRLYIRMRESLVSSYC